MDVSHAPGAWPGTGEKEYPQSGEKENPLPTSQELRKDQQSLNLSESSEEKEPPREN